MLIGVLKIELHIPEAASLKTKRMALKSLKDRLRNKFNISVAELDNHDKWQRATVGVAAISADKRYLNGQLSSVVNFVEEFSRTEMINYEMEIL